MHFCSWNTDIQAEGKQRLGMCWAGSRGWQLGRKFTTDCPDYAERALGSGEKGFLVTWSWASHFLSGPQLPYLEKLLNASGTCRTVVWMNEKHSRAPTVTKVLNKWNPLSKPTIYTLNFLKNTDESGGLPESGFTEAAVLSSPVNTELPRITVLMRCCF